MASLYDRTDIYDLLENEDRFQTTKTHWQTVFAGKEIRTLLDVSIGSGNLTLPLCALGTAVTGSDLSETMLGKCRAKAAARGFSVELHQADFRMLDRVFSGRLFDCVASTGNSLPYVTNSEIPGVLCQMNALVRTGGYLYLDLRNWDKIVAEKQRFYLYNPTFDGETRINLVQVWDHNADGTVDFNLLYTFERDNCIFQKEFFTERYHPVPRALLLVDQRVFYGLCIENNQIGSIPRQDAVVLQVHGARGVPGDCFEHAPQLHAGPALMDLRGGKKLA